MGFTPWAAGTKITAAKLAAMTPIFASWTPTWTTSSGIHSPSFGNATLNCDYVQSGDLVTCTFDIVFGGTTNFGTTPATTDNWRFTVPVTAAATAQTSGFVEANYDASNNHNVVCRVRLTTTTTVELQIASGETDGAAVGSTGVVDSLSPGTWTSGGYIRGNFFYEAA